MCVILYIVRCSFLHWNGHSTRCLTLTQDGNNNLLRTQCNPIFLSGGWTVRNPKESPGGFSTCSLQVVFNLLVRDCGWGNSHLSLQAAGWGFPQAPCPWRSGKFLPAVASRPTPQWQDKPFKNGSDSMFQSPRSDPNHRLLT